MLSIQILPVTCYCSMRYGFIYYHHIKPMEQLWGQPTKFPSVRAALYCKQTFPNALSNKILEYFPFTANKMFHFLCSRWYQLFHYFFLGKWHHYNFVMVNAQWFRASPITNNTKITIWRTMEISLTFAAFNCIDRDFSSKCFNDNQQNIHNQWPFYLVTSYVTRSESDYWVQNMIDNN